MKLNLRRIIIGLAVCLTCLSGRAQQAFRVLEYNVENFFDCRHDTLKNDVEFLPESIRGWSWKRFNDKRDKIAKVILAASDEQVPDVVALCEVENAYCMESLTKYSPLRDAGYRFVMTDSPDNRGIDVAFLYQPATFRVLGERHIRITPKESGERATRDLLYVAGRVVSGDTLDFVLCHFPSKAGGEKKSAPFRMRVAETLRSVCDSILSVRQQPHLIILGDFNDVPESLPLQQGLKAGKPIESPSSLGLYNLMYGQKDKGTYRYKGQWTTIDQVIVNGRLLLPDSHVRTSAQQVSILQYPFLMEQDERYGGLTPFRTYKGLKYHGGFSDHLPVLLKLTIDE